MALGYDTVPATASAGRALRSIIGAPSFQALDAGTQHDLAVAVDKVAGYLEADPAQTLGLPVAGQLAGADILRQRQQAGSGAFPAPSNGGPARQPAPGPAPAVPGQPAPAGTSATGRVGEVARATLNAIDFPQFVASLIQGTFKAIVDSSIQQMEAYAALLKNVAGTVDRYMDDNVTEGMAKDHLADEHPWLFNRDTSRGRPELTVNQTAPRELPSFLKDLGISSPRELNKNTVQEVVIPATRKTLAETRQQTLATMVLMGMNRVVVDDGEIKAKLMFHIDASETTAMKFDQQKATTASFGQEGVSGQMIMVNTASVNAQSDLNVRADLTGEVRVKFRSETFPLERFADSAAIQLINSNAKVPERPAPASAAPAPPAAPQVPAPPPLPPTIASPLPPQPQPPAPRLAVEPPPAPPATGQQGLESDDPWMPA